MLWTEAEKGPNSKKKEDKIEKKWGKLDKIKLISKMLGIFISWTPNLPLSPDTENAPYKLLRNEPDADTWMRYETMQYAAQLSTKFRWAVRNSSELRDPNSARK